MDRKIDCKKTLELVLFHWDSTSVEDSDANNWLWLWGPACERGYGLCAFVHYLCVHEVISKPQYDFIISLIKEYMGWGSDPNSNYIYPKFGEDGKQWRKEWLELQLKRYDAH